MIAEHYSAAMSSIRFSEICKRFSYPARTLNAWHLIRQRITGGEPLPETLKMQLFTEFKGREVIIVVEQVSLDGYLLVPKNALGLVIFAHGSGSSRLSERNRFVANFLYERNFATLLFDLLTRDEEAVDLRTQHLRFDIPLLAHRLEQVTRWAERHPDLSHLDMSYFGASTGAAAALIAAAAHPAKIAAIVSRGGRPDLARDALPKVKAPTLLIVGGADHDVIELNRQAQGMMSQGVAQVEIVPGATHLFEETGALEEVAELATTWFEKYLGPEQQHIKSLTGYDRSLHV